MELPEYITKEEVRRVCGELGIRDWTQPGEPEVTDREAGIILNGVNSEKMPIELEEFRKGLMVELEHGSRFPDANVTNNHPIVTGRIVLAHMKESLDYYRLLDVAELEGDLLKAIVKGDPAKIKAVYRKLTDARIALSSAQAARL